MPSARPRACGGHQVVIADAVVLATLFYAFPLTIVVDPTGGSAVVHLAREQAWRGPALWDDVAARRQAFWQTRRRGHDRRHLTCALQARRCGL